MNTSITHPELVKSLAKPGWQIKQMSANEAHLTHMSLGIAGEAGEIVDIVKKHVIYHKQLDPDKLTEEIGDLLFYVQGICQSIGVTLEQVLKQNITKLTKRYGEQYSDKAAIQRVDVQ